jgi:signal transduction histidine kinase
LVQQRTPNVFAVFWQHKVGDRAKPEGAGLGLAIARRLSHLLGGGITVSSEVGKGSTFTVTLPRDIPAYDSGRDDDEVLD